MTRVLLRERITNHNKKIWCCSMVKKEPPFIVNELHTLPGLSLVFVRGVPGVELELERVELHASAATLAEAREGLSYIVEQLRGLGVRK